MRERGLPDIGDRRKVVRISATYPGIESRSSFRHAPFRKIPGMGHTGGRIRRVARAPTHNATINIPSPDPRPHRLRVPGRESRGSLQHNTYHVLKLFP